MTRREKPTMHGRDHAPDGPDPVPGSGIQFDTSPQSGDWLEITTTGAEPGYSHMGMNLRASEDISLEARRIALESDTENINLSADENTVDIFGGVGVTITGNGDTGVIIETNGEGDFVIQANGDSNIHLNLVGGANALTINLGGGVPLFINGLPTSDPHSVGQVWVDASGGGGVGSLRIGVP